MIDYLKLETSLKKFFDYEAQKEHKKKLIKFLKREVLYISFY